VKEDGLQISSSEAIRESLAVFDSSAWRSAAKEYRRTHGFLL